MGDHVEVTPDDLRDAGTEIAGVREGIGDNASFKELTMAGMMPAAVNDTGRLSGGFFDASLAADHHVQRLNEALGTALTRVDQQLLALSSALHIVADVYHSADLENALEFAWNQPGGTAPAGLPAYVDPDNVVSLDPDQNSFEEADAAGQDAGAGGGSQAPAPHTYHPGWDRNRIVTEYYDADGAVTHQVHRIPHPDGSVTLETWEDGELTNEELASPDHGDALGRSIDEQLAASEREVEDAGLGWSSE